MKNRIWIELERDKSADCDKINTERAELATEMLRKLGIAGKDIIWWNERKLRFCVTIDSAGGYQEMADNGHWFNLDFLGRPAEQVRPLTDADTFNSTTA